MSNMGVLVGLLTMLSTAANSVILVTLHCTKQFSRSVKFHLGIIAVCDMMTAWLLLVRTVAIDASVQSIVWCKLIMSIMTTSAIASVLTNVSMNMECLQMLQISPQSKGCFVANRWQFSSRGKKYLALFTFWSCVHVLGFIQPTKQPRNAATTYTCAVIDSHVFHPTITIFFVVETISIAILNVCLLVKTIVKLNKVFIQSNKISKRTSTKGNKHFRSYVRPMTLLQRLGSRAHKSAQVAPPSVMTQDETSASTYHAPATAQTSTEQNDIIDANDVAVLPNHKQQQMSVASVSKWVALVEDGAPSQQVGANETKHSAHETKHSTNETRHSASENRHSVNQPTVTASQMRLLALMITATAFFTVCYMPWIVTLFLYVTCGEDCGVTATTVAACATPFIFHGVFNIVLYTVKNKDFRNSLRLKVC